MMMMKKIIPFNNVLEFNTDVKEITAISLEHEITKNPDMISGVFYISGEYKITEGLLDKEKFNFELPFDIALSKNYELNSLLVDIDDFRYDLISDKSLKVNIDLYIDGNEIEDPVPLVDELNRNNNAQEDDLIDEIINEMAPKEKITCEEKINTQSIDETIPQTVEIKTIPEENIQEPISQQVEIKSISKETEQEITPERIELLKDMLTNNKEKNMNEEPNLNINIDNENETENTNNNLFIPNQEEEKYVTYRVYKVLDTDTLESILTKYNITKDMLADYNNIENILPGDKLIIPTNEK